MNYNRNDVYYVCALIEYTARKTKNHRGDIVARLSDEDLLFELKNAAVNHCLSMEQVSDEWIENYEIPEGGYDTETTCLYKVPSATSIGKVYWRLVEDVFGMENAVSGIRAVFSSFLSDEISDFNSSVYYSTPEYLSWSFKEGRLLD